MTDNEIIKALERCGETDCVGCPYIHLNCRIVMARRALDLINRQRAEIERLENEKKLLVKNNLSTKYPVCMITGHGLICAETEEELNKLIAAIANEKLKELAERLKERLERKYTIYGREYVLRHLRELVKEMTEGVNDK